MAETKATQIEDKGDGQGSASSSADNSQLIKVKLLKAMLGKRPGQSLSATRAELEKRGLTEGEDYRYVGAWPKSAKVSSELANQK